MGLYFAPQLRCGFDHFCGAGGAESPPSPQRVAGEGGGTPPSPRGRTSIPERGDKVVFDLWIQKFLLPLKIIRMFTGVVLIQLA